MMPVQKYLSEAALLLTRNLRLADNDDLVIVCDDETRIFGALFEEAAKSINHGCTVVTFAPTGRHKAEPPSFVADAMIGATAVVSVTRWSLLHTEARRAANTAGARVLCVSDVQLDLFARGVLTVDINEILPRLTGLSMRLTASSRATLITGGGVATLNLDLTDRVAIDQSGLCAEPGSWTALPCIETAICPHEYLTNGEIVIDGAVVPGGAVVEPIYVTVVEGRVVDVWGGAQGIALNNIVRHEEGYGVVELGIGLNPRAEFGKHFAEDEAVWGTVHIGIGDGESFGSSFRASQHIDLVAKKPTLLLDGVPVISVGTVEQEV